MSASKLDPAFMAHGAQYEDNVMFLCNHNSCRSQMADGWLRHLRGDASVGVASAGIVGGTEVKPGAFRRRGLPRQRATASSAGAVVVMNEVGVDISSFKSDAVADYGHTEFSVVISCCGPSHPRGSSFSCVDRRN